MFNSFADWAPGNEVPYDIYLVYAIQGGYYLHRIVDTLFHDIWRTDTIVMSLHHILSLTLIAFSYATRYMKLAVFLWIFAHLSLKKKIQINFFLFFILGFLLINFGLGINVYIFMYMLL